MKNINSPLKPFTNSESLLTTNNLLSRAGNHKDGINDGFTKRYKIKKLLYYEVCETIEGAITREKQIKAGSRQNKINLITGMNPGWNDLYDELTK